ncbi:MAG: hypothetical protein IRZ08_05250 [Frankia sp.]|nr:hypothetical protein [Frankia sp.]
MTTPRHPASAGVARPRAAVAAGVRELRLVSRRHVDLLRVASAGCRRAR